MRAKKPLDVPEEDLVVWDVVLKLALVNRFTSEKDNEILYRKTIRLLAALALKKVKSMKETKE